MSKYDTYHELNLMVAREVFGWRRVYPAPPGTDIKDYWLVGYGETLFLDNCPNFADDWEAMELVIQAMVGESKWTDFTAKERCFRIEVSGPTTSGRWQASFYQLLHGGHVIGHKGYAVGDTMPMAVALAALRSLGITASAEVLAGQA